MWSIHLYTSHHHWWMTHGLIGYCSSWIGEYVLYCSKLKKNFPLGFSAPNLNLIRLNIYINLKKYFVLPSSIHIYCPIDITAYILFRSFTMGLASPTTSLLPLSLKPFLYVVCESVTFSYINSLTNLHVLCWSRLIWICHDVNFVNSTTVKVICMISAFLSFQG